MVALVKKKLLGGARLKANRKFQTCSTSEVCQ